MIQSEPYTLDLYTRLANRYRVERTFVKNLCFGIVYSHKSADVGAEFIYQRCCEFLESQGLTPIESLQ